MRWTDLGMRARTAEELRKLNCTSLEIAKAIGCSTTLVNYWLNEEGVPSHSYLKRLYGIGCDILYIITGVHQ